MFNVTVIRLKDLIKYPVVIIISMIMIYFTTRYFFDKNKTRKLSINIDKKIEGTVDKYLLYPIDEELSYSNTKKTIENIDKLIDENIELENKEFTTNLLDKAFELQFGRIKTKDEDLAEATSNSNLLLDESEDNKNQKELDSKDNNSKIITKNPIQETYNLNYNGVKIRNGTSYKLNDKILNPKSLKIDTSNVLIFHTHTCESYTQSEKYQYKATGNYRTTDLNFSVARAGNELTNYLKNQKFNVIHDVTYHDYPQYNGSYARSLSTVSNILKKQKSDIIIDLHRDAIGSNSKYDPTIKIGDDECAQLMFVMRYKSEED